MNKDQYGKNFLTTILLIFGLSFSQVSLFAQEKQILTSRYPRGLLKQIIPQPGDIRPFPDASSSFWRDSIPLEMRQSYIAFGEKFLGKPWATLPATVFSDFRTNGNRDKFEKLSFERRRQLAALVMAEIVEGKNRFLPDIINGLIVTCEETWWGIPAHYGKKVAMPEDYAVDLFVAETANLMVWSSYMLREQLDQFSPLICQRITKETERRILIPTLENNHWWKKVGMNWNSWICSNWLACVLLAETDRERQLDGIEAIFRCLDIFIDAYPEDGGCDEGPGYWDRAAASLSEALNLLQSVSDKFDVSDSPKIAAMGSFLYKTYVGNGYYVNFADASNKTRPNIAAVYPFGLYIKDQMMCSFAAFIAQEHNYFTEPAELFEKSGNYPALSREIMLLAHLPSLQKEQPRDAMVFDSWLPDLQVITARSKKHSNESFYIAAKGGHNNESHNHNDVGTFTLYAGGEPLLIDVGVGTYTAKTFGKDRYDIWTMQSGYHSVPCINGVDQQQGGSFAAREVTQRITNKEVYFSLDIAGAYPEDASVDHWQRTIRFRRSKDVRITEEYKLNAYKQPSEIRLMTSVEPIVSRSGTIELTTKTGSYCIDYDANALKPVIENVPLDDRRIKEMWGTVYRIRLQVLSPVLNNKISYIIREKK